MTSGGPPASRFVGGLHRRSSRSQSVQAGSRPRQRTRPPSSRRNPARLHDSTRTRRAARRMWRSPCKQLAQSPPGRKRRAGARKADRNFPRRFIPSAALPAVPARERFRRHVFSRKTVRYVLTHGQPIRHLLRLSFRLATKFLHHHNPPGRTFLGGPCTNHHASRNESPK